MDFPFLDGQKELVAQESCQTSCAQLPSKIWWQIRPWLRGLKKGSLLLSRLVEGDTSIELVLFRLPSSLRVQRHTQKVRRSSYKVTMSQPGLVLLISQRFKPDIGFAPLRGIRFGEDSNGSFASLVCLSRKCNDLLIVIIVCSVSNDETLIVSPFMVITNKIRQFFAV